MNLHTNLKGRLRNTSLPKASGLLPVFEAVVNSIHSIEELNLSGEGTITLELIRTGQLGINLGEKTNGAIVGFKITDSGCGFNDRNLESFETLDSDHKIEKGCRGVGRLLWLKAFEYATVSSVYVGEGLALKQREFRFDAKDGVSQVIEDIADEQKTGTEICLIDFHESYRKACPKTAKGIADSLLEHCLWYFVRDKGCPDIYVKDGEDVVRLYQLFDSYMHSSAFGEKITIGDELFELTHIKFRASSNKKHSLALCAANRLVKEESLQGKIPGLYSKIEDESGAFIYNCYVASKFLDDNVRAERTSFDITEKFDGLFSDTEISMKIIRETVLERSKLYLKDILESNVIEGRQRVNDFINEKAPRYKPITKHMDEASLIVDPEITDQELDIHLHSQWAEVENQLLIDGHKIMGIGSEERFDDYSEKLQKYLNKAEDIKKSDLANYVSHRKVIIDLLEKAIQIGPDGKYVKEELIHELIMPMGTNSRDLMPDVANLWLIDERLAFHNYLASDKTLKSMPITGNETTKEPDLISLRMSGEPLLVADSQSMPLASITVIEIKRPMRNDMKEGEDKDPIEQALGYLSRVREGKVKTSSGILIPNSQNLPGYCYVICDLTEKMIKRCKYAGLTVTADRMGYFGYNKNYEAYIEVISFNQLVSGAKERNRAFFEKLGLPSL
jgi:hypothetical protein